MYRSTKGASKARRDQINAEIRNLKDLLPISDAEKARLSYLHIMSLASMYTRKSVFFSQESGSAGSLEESARFLSFHELSELVQELPGFLLLLTGEGKLLYLSDSVSEHLGHSMVDLVAQGDSVYDIIDPTDHFIMRTNLAPPTSPDTDRLFRCRFNTSKSVRRQSAGNKLVLVRARCPFPPSSSTTPSSYWTSNPVWMCFCSPLEAVPTRSGPGGDQVPALIPPAAENNFFLASFQSQHSRDMRLQNAQDSVSVYLGLDVSALRSRSWYSLLHPQDLSHASTQHCSLLREGGEGRSEMVVRVESADHSWVWLYMVLQLEAGDSPISSNNYIISEAEAWSVRQQLSTEQTQLTLVLSTSTSRQDSLSLSSPDQSFFQQQQMPAPQTWTSSLRTFSCPPPSSSSPRCPPSPFHSPPVPTSQEQQTKEFVCTPPYTPQLAGAASSTTSIAPSLSPSAPPTTASSPVPPSSLCLTGPSTDLFFPADPCSGSIYEKLPPTPDSPRDGDCTVMTLPEVRGPLYVDVPLGPFHYPLEGLLTPEASPGKQPGLSFFSLDRERDKERAEISLLAQHISSLAEGFYLDPLLSKLSPPSMSPSSSPPPPALSPSVATAGVDSIHMLGDVQSAHCYPTARCGATLASEARAMAEWEGLGEEPMEIEVASSPLSSCSSIPASPPLRLTASPASAPSTPVAPNTPAVPCAQSLLEELAALEPMFGAGASIAPGLGQQPELYQLQCHQPPQCFHKDGSGSVPPF
ncbi:unnamed protein product [Oncorhynchus mykiss]|uniref:BHLH domain-containing protein n=1 Tax=Oncorhynchus mykiss TaxID=8022 RepID=A0A060YTB6_ONCMY|nr:unnamed protein product [Oncorhynchus mykiss]